MRAAIRHLHLHPVRKTEAADTFIQNLIRFANKEAFRPHWDLAAECHLLVKLLCVLSTRSASLLLFFLNTPRDLTTSKCLTVLYDNAVNLGDVGGLLPER